MSRKLGIDVGVALLVVLAGCSGLAGSTGGAAVGDETELDRSIEVNADGEATAEPDRATIRVAVTATGSDPETVRDELTTGDNELRAALTDWGLDEDDIRTDRYDVRETRHSREEPDRDEYEGVHRYEVAIDDVDAVGEVIDVAVDAGADEVQRIQFGLSEERESEIRETAIENAMENADADAAVLAESSDLTVAGVYTVSTGNSGISPYRVSNAEMMAADGADSAATGIETGDVSVRVSVNVVYVAQQA